MNQLPNQLPNTFNANELQNPNVLNIPEQEVSSSSRATNSELGDTPANRKIIKNLKHIYAILLVSGLIMGGVISVGIITALNKLEVTDVPARVDER